MSKGEDSLITNDQNLLLLRSVPTLDEKNCSILEGVVFVHENKDVAADFCINLAFRGILESIVGLKILLHYYMLIYLAGRKQHCSWAYFRVLQGFFSFSYFFKLIN